MTIGEERFADFFANTPAATTPLAGTEPMLVLQGGLTKQIPVGAGVGNATVFYVSPSGSDTNPGTSSAKAWQTIAKINASTFLPGTVILFQGGQTFSGAIVCPSSGTPGGPITFGSYGGNQATISSGTSNGFTSTNQAGIVVRDLTFTGSASTNTGVLFTNGLANNIHLQNIQAINLNVSGYGQDGIRVKGTAGYAGYADVLIQGCTVTSCCSVASSDGHGTAGIHVHSPAGYGLLINLPSFNNVIIDNCYVANCPGATDVNWTGSGIFVAQTYLGIIRNCEANGNGASANFAGGGPFGIWTSDATTITITNCRAINNSTANTDGGGFDLDGGCTDCLISDCYSSGNTGPGYAIISYNDGTVTTNSGSKIVNCFSTGDGTGGVGSLNVNASASATLSNFAITNCAVYNNQSGACIAFVGANISAATGEIINCSLTASAAQSFFSGATPAGVVVSGVLEFANAALFNLVTTIRQKAAANLNFYFSTTGSDSNNGSSGSPWATVQHGINYVAANIDGAGFNVIFNLGAGSFAGFGMMTMLGVSFFQIAGASIATTTLGQGPNDGIFNLGNVMSNFVEGSPITYVYNLTLDATGAGVGPNGVWWVTGQLNMTDPRFLQGFNYKLAAGVYGFRIASGAYFSDAEGIGPGVTLTGNAAAYLIGIDAENVQLGEAYTISGAPTYSDAFVIARLSTGIQAYGTFTGSATGVRFKVATGASINANDSAGTLFPGNAVGQITGGGQYTGITDFIGVVGSLPSANIQGTTAFVTDALAATFGSAPTGGHGTFVPVYNTGSGWIMG